MGTRAIQGKLWSVAPQYWAQFFEPWFMPMYRVAIDELKLSDRDSVLDAGCGSGLFSHLAIQQGAQLIGIDAAPGLLEVARSRNPHNNFLEEDLEAMPFADESFDVVAGFNSFQYAGSFDNALKEAARVLKPGGRLVLGIWDKPEASDATNVLKAISSLLPPPPPGMPGPFALSEDGRIVAACKQQGLQVVFQRTVACPFLYRSKEEAVKSFMGTGPAAAAMNSHPQEKVEWVIGQAMKPYEVAEGMHFLQNHFLLFIAVK